MATQCLTAELHVPGRRQRPTFRLSDIWRAPLHDLPIRDEILYQYLPLSKEMELLEIGPGSGFTAFRLAQCVSHITLLDIASQNIDQLRQALSDIHNISFVCEDICKANLAARMEKRFDAVFAIEVFELLPDPGTCLKNLGSVLKPGGQLLIQFPNYPPPKNPGNTYFPKRTDLDELLINAGFQNWKIYSLALRSVSQLVFSLFHEQPLNVYRKLRNSNGPSRPQIYDESWAFRQGSNLAPFKLMLHAAWALLFAAMRAGGKCFEATPLDSEVINRNLLVLAQR